MCVMVYKPQGVSLDLDRIKILKKTNPDGLGFATKGRIYRSISMDTCILCYIEKEDNAIIHFRTASSSDKSIFGVHPFTIPGHNLIMMHNGNFPNLASKNMTDTESFALILSRLPIGFLQDHIIKSMIEDICKYSFSKMLIMDNNGDVTILNEEAGEWSDGLWYSNGGLENYCGYGFSGLYYYDGRPRHIDGLQSIAMFSETEKKKWHQCIDCGGYFYMIQDKCGWCERIKNLCNAQTAKRF